MVHGLPRMAAGVEHDTVASVGDPFGHRHRMGRLRDLREQPVPGGGEAGQIRIVWLRNDQNVNRRLRIDIAECERTLGFEYSRRRNFGGCDFAE